MKNAFIKKFILTLIIMCVAFLTMPMKVFADENEYSLGVSPMTESIILSPGKVYSGNIIVSNPASNTSELGFIVSVSPFYVDENYKAYYGSKEDANQIVDWINLETTEGTLAPNSTEKINFTINVPEDAPAGGQYAAIMVQTKSSDTEIHSSETGVNINQVLRIAHAIYAEITGATSHSGEIASTDLPSFLFSGNITASSSVKNTGNVHDTAKYTMQIFPLFSSEEIFTNEESPETKIVLPDRTLYHETIWGETPSIGIFNVIYTVEFEGITTQVSKMVIICPIWLLFIIIFAIFALIFYFIAKARARKKATKK